MLKLIDLFFWCFQVELQGQIEEWRQSKPESKFLFRPYGSAEPAASADQAEDSDTDETHPPAAGIFKGSGGGDGDDALRDGSKPGHSLLFVHQEAWQREILAKFGDFAMIDATYRTTMYDVALFFIVVPTNVGITVVAEFCVQSEGAEEITEALNVSNLSTIGSACARRSSFSFVFFINNCSLQSLSIQSCAYPYMAYTHPWSGYTRMALMCGVAALYKSTHSHWHPFCTQLRTCAFFFLFSLRGVSHMYGLAIMSLISISHQEHADETTLYSARSCMEFIVISNCAFLTTFI